MTRARDMVEFKAVSENVMHSNVQITDKAYSNLKANELRNRIHGLEPNYADESTQDKIISMLEEILRNAER